MWLDEFIKVSITDFNGLYARGLADEVPQDHASDIKNIVFSKKSEIRTRPGTSTNFTNSQAKKRQFLATFSNNTSWLLTCDGAGNIYLNNSTTPFLTVTNMIDFAAINMFNKVFIAPILSVYSATNGIYVWNGSSPVRLAAGYADTTGTLAATTTGAGTGKVAPGVHQIAVSFVTDSGFVTQPGPKISGVFTPVSYTAPGSAKIALSGIPTGPAGTVGRQILVTQANQSLFYYLSSGYINDNVSTTLTIDFYDTDLAVQADSLFDNLELIPSAATVFGGLSLNKYHNRLFAIGVNNNIVLVSNAGDAETFNSVTGFIQIPDENDGNIVRSAATIYDTLYFMKSVGIYSAQDNGGDPSTWSVVQIDGAVGSYQSGIGTITGSQTALSSNAVLLLTNREGIFVFNGTVIRPQLTWKIQDVWDTITHGSESQVQVAVDIFSDTIYVILPTNGSTTPNLMLVGDYSEGLDSQNIRWSKFVFPWTPISISMINYQDTAGTYDYYLRLGTTSTMYNLIPTNTSDGGNAINSYYQFAPIAGEIGALNVFRALRFRVLGSGTLSFSLSNADGTNVVNSTTAQNITLAASPGIDIIKQINYMCEKMMIKVNLNTTNGYFNLERLDIFVKKLFGSRPA
jgi:hypothetical protein